MKSLLRAFSKLPPLLRAFSMLVDLDRPRRREEGDLSNCPTLAVHILPCTVLFGMPCSWSSEHALRGSWARAGFVHVQALLRAFSEPRDRRFPILRLSLDTHTRTHTHTHTHIQSLRIAGCPDMTDDAFTTPLTSPNLSSLDLRYR